MRRFDDATFRLFGFSSAPILGLKSSLTAQLLLALAADGRPNLKDLEKSETGMVAAVKAGDRLAPDCGLPVALTGIEALRRGCASAGKARTALTGPPLASPLLAREVAVLHKGDAGGPIAPNPLQRRPTPPDRPAWPMPTAGATIMPARAPCWHSRAGALLAAKAAARQAKLGVWATPAFAVRRPDCAAGAIKACKAAQQRGDCQSVEGRVLAARDGKGRTCLVFVAPVR